MPTRRALIAQVAALCIPLGMLAACGGAGNGATSGSATDTLTIAATAAVPSLDPLTSTMGFPLGTYVQAAYDPLILRQADGSYAPALASEFGYVGAGNRSFHIKVRNGVKFSDGTTLDAEGLKAWFEYAAKTAGPFQGVFQNVTSIKVDDASDVTLSLKDPDPNLEYNLSQDQAGFPISAEATKSPDLLKSGTYGAGPYVFDKVNSVIGTRFTYVRNPNYWNKEQQHWKKVVITVVPDLNAALSAVKSGQAMLTSTTPQLAEAVTGQTITNIPTYFAGLLILDRGGKVVPALGDPRVRQAMNYAVDRDAITKGLYGKYGTPSAQGLTKGVSSFVPDLENAYGYHPDKAKQLLTDAGYANGFTLPIAVVPFGGQETAIVQAIAGYLNKVGIRTDIKPYSSIASAFQDVAAKKVAVIPETTWFVQDIDIVARAQLLPGLSVVNPFTETPENELQTLYRKAESAPSDVRTTALQALQTYIVDNGLYLHTTVADIIYVSSKQLGPLGVTDADPIVTLGNIKPAH